MSAPKSKVKQQKWLGSGSEKRRPNWNRTRKPGEDPRSGDFLGPSIDFGALAE